MPTTDAIAGGFSSGRVASPSYCWCRMTSSRTEKLGLAPFTNTDVISTELVRYLWWNYNF